MAKLKEGPAKNAIRQKALRILKQKKVYEGQQGHLLQQGFNMDQMIFAQESLKDTTVAVRNPTPPPTSYYQSHFRVF
jgi:charged multivesicular body protein 5